VAGEEGVDVVIFEGEEGNEGITGGESCTGTKRAKEMLTKSMGNFPTAWLSMENEKLHFSEAPTTCSSLAALEGEI
jgi:hypothetical protein